MPANSPESQPGNDSEQTELQPYSAPTLTRHGSVAGLTKFAGPGIADGELGS